MQSKIYFIDNFDSFSYNLVDEFAQLGYDLIVYRNNICANAIMAKIEAENVPVVIVLSPGPGTPKQAGCLLELIDLAKGKYPILGICLGHQALVESYGGTVGHAGETVHGKSSQIALNDHPIFAALGANIPVARYHSLMATEVPSSLNIIAQYQDIPMAVISESDKALGFQFHPESILTPNGAQLIQQSLAYLTAKDAL